MRGHTEFLGGLKKVEGARLSGGLLQRGVVTSPAYVTLPVYVTSGINPYM